MLTKELGDGHSFFNAKGDTLMNSFLGMRTIPMKTQFIENKLVVTELIKGREEEYRVRIGDEIKTIGGRDVLEVFKERENFFPSSNENTKLFNTMPFMLRTNSEELALELRNGQKEFTEVLSTVHVKDFNYYEGALSSHKDIEENIGYINIGALKQGELSSIMESYKNKQGIVIDFRQYPMIDLGELMKFFTNKGVPFVKYSLPNKYNLGSENLSDESLTYGDANHYYSGKISVLVDENTMSAGEFYTMALQTSPNVKVFGTQTAGADGNVSTLMLPGNIQVMFSGIGIYYPDGSETQKVGIKIDEYVCPTIEALKENRDLILEKGIENLL